MRLLELSANDKVLELGGGSNPVCPGRWTNLDCRELPGVDIVASLEETLPIEDESYDGVFCSYAIEHIPWRKVRDFLSEVRRILKPEGRAIFITANLKEQAKLIGAKDRWDGDFESCLIFGDQDYPENTHRVGFSPEYAERLFGELGFQAKVEPHPSCPTDMVITAVKTPLDRLTWVRNEVGKLTKDKPDALIVDIGCADCPITYDMANCTWVDSDSYEKVAQDMRTLGRTQIPREKFIQASADDLPFENKIFEVALNTELLEHVADPAKVLKETKRVARHVIITVPDEYSWSLDHKPFQNPGHLRHYTESMLKEQLKRAKIKKYSLDKLDYQGWSFFTVVADLGTVSTVKKRKLPKLTSDFYDKEYFTPNSAKSNYILPFTWEVEGKKSMEEARYIMDNFSPQSVLDIGCAKGFLVKALLASGVDAQGCDISKWAVENCEPEVKDRLKIADIRDGLPYPNKSFDAVCSLNTLEHIEIDYLDFVAKEMARVAKKWVYIEVPLSLHWDKSMPDYSLDINDLSHRTYLPAKHWETLFANYCKLESSVIVNPEVLGVVYPSAKLTFSIRSAKEATALVVRPSGDRLKIALLSTPFIKVPPRAYGGLELVLRDEAYALAKQGHQVTVFAPDDSYVEGCEMACFGPALEKVQVNWLQAETDAINKVSSRLMNDGYDIICGHDWFGMEYALKAQKPELKVCHTHHGGLNMDWWGTSKPPWPLNLIAISKWMQKVYQSQGFTSRVVYNGIAIEDYLFKATKGSRLLFVGRLDSFKRPLVAIEVARKAGLGLDIVGGSFVADVAYMEKVKQACDGEQIKLYLDAPHEKKVELYQNAKAVIFPSKMGEPFGLIVPEANACGTSVIASPDGAIPETLQDRVTGFICYTIDAMVKAVGKVDLIKPEACRERVERLFTREIMAKNYLEAYRDILLGKEW
ncbi:Ubiquinone biosynthesis O-methyltransferase, mitochondrial [subsurface metagenome]